MGETDKAIEVLEAMRERYDYVNAHVLTTLGYMYLLKGNCKKAIEITNKAIEESPQYSAAWDNLGQIYFKQGDMEKAKQAFETGLAGGKGIADTNFYLGLIAEQEGDMDGAKRYFETAAGCAINSLNTVSRGMIEERLGKYN